MQKKTIRLQSCLKQYTYDQDKACTPVETVERFRQKLKATGLDIPLSPLFTVSCSLKIVPLWGGTECDIANVTMCSPTFCFLVCVSVSEAVDDPEINTV